jgi:protein-tyrosine-phosphatase
MPNILFICTANQCRSPMAEAILRRKLDGARYLGDGWTVASAAVWGEAGLPATRLAIQVAGEHGLELERHRSQRVEDLDLAEYDLIIAMQVGHQEALRAEFPGLADRIHLLSELSGPSYGVRDPAGGDLDDVRRTYAEIERLINDGFDAMQVKLEGEGG